MNQLITGETYFFRDQGQFALLKNWILPELIKNKKTDKTLRIWSAGCSTGEEAYSLAILVDGLALEGWDTLILGTDINDEALNKARKGNYGEWSFRQVGEDIREQYFRKKKNEWTLDERIRGMVSLEVMNLITDTYPDYGKNLHDMDLILCRNVFIYFKPEIVSKTVEKMTGTLSNGGYLMTGHAEIRAREFPHLKARVFPESVVYQKSAGLERREASFVKLEAPQEMRDTFHEIRKTGHVSQDKISSQSAIEKSEFELAREYADSGRYDDAARSLGKAIKADPFRPGSYFLLAQIAREMGNSEEEKEMLKKVIYLDPSYTAGFLELAVIYDEEGDFPRASKMRTTALELLKRLRPEVSVEPYEGMTAGELVKHVEKIVHRT